VIQPVNTSAASDWSAISAGHEGVMVKAVDSTYDAGRRGGAWRKVKPVKTLDLVVLAAEWGHGRREGWLSNLHLGAGGAGIPAFYTPTGVGTMVAENKETREFEGRTYLMEHALKADFAFVKAWKGDKWGNLVYRKTARNFNPMMATAAKLTIAEVEEIVPVGTLDPEHIHTPGIYVNRIIQGKFEKRIERRMLRAEHKE